MIDWVGLDSVGTPQDLEAAFGMLDEDRDGKLTKSEAGLVIPKSWGAPQVMDGSEMFRVENPLETWIFFWGTPHFRKDLYGDYTMYII